MTPQTTAVEPYQPRIVTMPNKRDRVDEHKVAQITAGSIPFDRLSNQKAEEALLALALRNPMLYHQYAEQIQPSDFFFLANGWIWWAIGESDRQRRGTDVVNVMQVLSVKLPDTATKLASVMSADCRIDFVESYIRSIRDYAMLRRTLDATDKIRALILSGSATASMDAFVDQCNQLVFKATEQRFKQDATLDDTIDAFMDEVEARMDSGLRQGFLTGFRELDERMGGLQPGELTILGGYAGSGKSTWMLSMLMKALQLGQGVALFSLEMSKKEILQALIAMLAGIPKTTLKGAVLSSEQHCKMTEALAIITKLPLYIVDKFEYPQLTPLQHRLRLRALRAQYRIDISVIDGIWLMESDNHEPERHRAVHQITIDLIKDAGEFGIPVMALQQYKQEITERMMGGGKKVKRPVLYDFAESAAMQRNPQNVIALHRPSLFGQPDDATYAYILKDRNGSVVNSQPVMYSYNHQYSRYED